MEIAKQMVGRVIGRAGTTIRSLQAQTGANLSIDQNVPDGAPCVITITGNPDAVANAKQQINELISGTAPAGMNTMPAPGGAEKVLKIEQQHVGKIIGKGGETIKGMQNSTGARIHIDQTEWTCTITGTPQAVDQAAGMIQTITAGGDPPNFGPPGAGGYGAPPQYGGGYGGGYPAPAYGGYGPPPGYGGYAPPPSYGGGYGAPQGYGGGQWAPPAQHAPQQYPPAQYPPAQYPPAQQPAPQAQAAPAPAAASSPWQQHYDQQGRMYYYNATTQQSQWEKPADMP
jgi:far upstream element-binding protein